MNGIDKIFKPGDKIVLRPEGHPGHRNYWDSTTHPKMVGRIFTVECLGSSDGCWWDDNGVARPVRNIKLDEEGEYFWDSRFELVEYSIELAEKLNLSFNPQKHAFKAGDKVVIRPGDSADHLANRILTVAEVADANAQARLYFKEHSQPRTGPYPLGGFYASRFEPFEYKFKEGDKVVLRHKDHLGHRGCDDVHYLDDQVFTVKRIKSGTYNNETVQYLFFEEWSTSSSYWASRFEFAPVEQKAEDGFVPKRKTQETPNQVYINHIYERLIQEVTPSELLELADKLIKIGNERRLI